MTGIFITGTGTDVGKSIVTASLLRSLYQSSLDILAIKPIQTGMLTEKVHCQGDEALYTAALQGMDSVPSYLSPRTLHTFALPASPHLASAQEKYHLSVNNLVNEIQDMAHSTAQIAQEKRVPNQKRPSAIMLEGAGGVFVPLNDRETTLDLMQALNFPIILVMGNMLGALNHTLLTIESLQNRGLSIAAIVCTELCPRDSHNATLLQDNIDYVRRTTSIPLWELPFIPEFSHTESLHAIKPSMENAWDKAATALKPLASMLAAQWGEDQCLGSQASVASQDDIQNSISSWDIKHLWHPYTSASNPLPVYEACRTKGTRIYIKDNKAPCGERALIDGMASWWCAIHGYGHEALVSAAKKQAESMAHVMFGGLTHAPAVECAQAVLALLPSSLSRLFWADSGSVSVEVALKMALQYQQGKNVSRTNATPRHRILTPLGGYHGDTMGAMSVCDPVNGMHGLFRGAVAEQLFIARPSCRFDAPFDPASTAELERAFAEHGHTLAAVIVEPIVQGAGGMWFYHPDYLRRMRELCDAYDVLLIFDEIATGFGRTGKMFAAEWAGVSPDICCIGKALTGGFMTLAATICTEDVAQTICANGNVFMHGPTFMGNPLACSVAKASMELLTSSPWQSNLARIENDLKRGLEPCRHMPDVADVRVLGSIGLVEMQSPVNMKHLQSFFVEHGVWIRPFARLIYIMPPYISTSEDIRSLTDAVLAAIYTKAYI